MGLIDAMVYKLWSWMSTHATAYAAHIADASAHHTKYTDAEVDAIVLTHKNIASAHHTKYTDAEVDAIVLTHKNIANAHHTKYTDAEAVSAVATGDDYIKNTGDTMTEDLHLAASKNIIGDGDIALRSNIDAGFAKIGSLNENNVQLGMFGKTYTNVPYRGCMVSYFGSKDTYLANANVDYRFYPTGGGFSSPKFTVYETKIDFHNNKIVDPKNHAASALSGTKKLVEIDIGGTSYYFEVYPTKA